MSDCVVFTHLRLSDLIHVWFIITRLASVSKRPLTQLYRTSCCPLCYLCTHTDSAFNIATGSWFLSGRPSVCERRGSAGL